jgi:uncharacterized protein with ATP-grasp and redox domains
MRIAIRTDKRILELTDGPTCGADPFAQQKADSLEGATAAFDAACKAGLSETHDLAPLVAAALWGNLADLSVSAGSALIAPEVASAGERTSGGGAPEMMLADDTDALCQALAGCSGREIILVLDNCGLELVSDLLLVDGLLRMVQPSRVVLHVKDRPVFVSDATPADIPTHIDWLAKQAPDGDGGAMAARLRAATADGRLAVESRDFYTGALPFWRMPTELHSEHEGAALTILKGDANYRRLLGDLHWPHDTSFAELLDYWPGSVAALRTCKSGVLVGTPPEVEAAAAAEHPDKWLVGGLYGCVQARLV